MHVLSFFIRFDGYFNPLCLSGVTISFGDKVVADERVVPVDDAAHGILNRPAQFEAVRLRARQQVFVAWLEFVAWSAGDCTEMSLRPGAVEAARENHRLADRLRRFDLVGVPADLFLPLHLLGVVGHDSDLASDVEAPLTARRLCLTWYEEFNSHNIGLPSSSSSSVSG